MSVPAIRRPRVAGVMLSLHLGVPSGAQPSVLAIGAHPDDIEIGVGSAAGYPQEELYMNIAVGQDVSCDNRLRRKSAL
jgi:hypothetical protein